MWRTLLPLVLAAMAFFVARDCFPTSPPVAAASTLQPKREVRPGAVAAAEGHGAQFRRDAAAAMSAWRLLPPDERASKARDILALLLENDSTLTGQILPYLDELVSEQCSFFCSEGEESRAAATLLALPESKGRDILLGKVAQVWLPRDWKAATAWAEKQSSPLRENLLLRLATQKFAGPDASDAFQWAARWLISDATPQQRQQFGGYYVDHMAKTDPGAAIAWAQSNLAGRPLATALASVFQKQAVANPVVARALVEELPPGGARRRAAFAVVENQPDEAAVRWLLAEANRDAQDWMRTSGNWAERDPDAWRKFMETEDPDQIPLYMIFSGIESLSRKDGAGTLEWAVATGRPKYITASLEYLSDRDPVAAAAWITAHPDTPLQEGAVFVAVDRQFRRNPGDTAAWAAALPQGPHRTAALAAVEDRISNAVNLPSVEKDALRAVIARQ